MMRIKKERTVGIRIEFIPEFRNSNVSDFKPIAVIAKEETPIWKDELDDFLENGAVGKPFMRDKLALTADEIRDLKISFAGLKNVMSSITAHSIKVIKTNNV